MTDKHIGQTIAYLRKLRKLTQQQLADGICSREYIRKLENGYNQPTIYIIDLLSQRLQEDIYNYNLSVERHNDIETHIKIQEINDILASRDFELLKKKIQQYMNIPSFNEGEALQVIYYSNAMCEYYLNIDYDKVIDYCLKGLNVYKQNFNLSNWNKYLYSNIELRIINTIASCKCITDEYENGIKIFYELLEYLNKYISVTLYSIRVKGHFHITLYTQVAYNLSTHLTKKEKYNEALKIIDDAIDVSLRTKFMDKYPYLLKNKFQLLYMLNDIENAKIYYDKALIYYKDLLPEKELVKLINETKEQYPNILL